MHVCFAATAKNVFRYNVRVFLYLQKQTLRIGHRPLVAATVEVLYAPGQQVPRRPDGHFCLVVTTKDAREVVMGVLIEIFGIDAHLDQFCIRKHIISKRTIHIAISTIDIPR